VWRSRLAICFWIEGETSPPLRPTSFNQIDGSSSPLCSHEEKPCLSAPPWVLKITSGSRLWMVQHGIHLYILHSVFIGQCKPASTSAPGRMDGKWLGNSFRWVQVPQLLTMVLSSVAFLPYLPTNNPPRTLLLDR
jgi:hypothetical protein